MHFSNLINYFEPSVLFTISETFHYIQNLSRIKAHYRVFKLIWIEIIIKSFVAYLHMMKTYFEEIQKLFVTFQNFQYCWNIDVMIKKIINKASDFV